MSHAPVSVIVVSHGRPALLTRCLTGLSQLTHPNFEVIVVADPKGGAEAVRATGLSVKLSEFDELNISAARNRGGLSLASGDLVAFIDDDSVPEPSWLDHLTDPFEDPRVVAAGGGYVRARNGISFQWRANTVDALGAPAPLQLDGDAPQLFAAKPGHGIKTEGTNSAFRCDVLAKIGGFDPGGFRFYLDETDVNLRLSGQVTAIVPLAQVHHGYAPPSVRRGGVDRMPRSLHEVGGASSALFLRKHAPDHDPWGGALAALEARQRDRLLSHMVAGNCEPRDVKRILATLRAGWVEGLARSTDPRSPPLPNTPPPFVPFCASPPAPPESVHLSGRAHQRRALRAQARKLVKEGKSVTLFLLSPPTTLFHHLRFHPDAFGSSEAACLGGQCAAKKNLSTHGGVSRSGCKRMETCCWAAPLDKKVNATR